MTRRRRPLDAPSATHLNGNTVIRGDQEPAGLQE